MSDSIPMAITIPISVKGHYVCSVAPREEVNFSRNWIIEPKGAYADISGNYFEDTVGYDVKGNISRIKGLGLIDVHLYRRRKQVNRVVAKRYFINWENDTPFKEHELMGWYLGTYGKKVTLADIPSRIGEVPNEILFRFYRYPVFSSPFPLALKGNDPLRKLTPEHRLKRSEPKRVSKFIPTNIESDSRDFIRANSIDGKHARKL
jgi:hypothetical protein